jgi:O-antigen/teichoic acid export membrane protein
MGTVALAGIVHKVALLLLVIGAIAADTGIEGVAAAHLLANLLQWVFFARLVRLRYTRTTLRIDLAHWRYLLGESIPMGVGLVLRRMTIHLGTFLLAALAGAVAVGLYNSAYRFLQMIEIGAVAVTGVLFPVFSRLFATAPEQFRRLYGDSFRFMLVLAAPIAGMLVAFGSPMVLAIYGPDFREAGPVLQVLGAALLFLVPGAVMHSVFSALGKQQLFMKLSMVGVLSTAALGLLLIPSYGSLGAAWATLGTEAIVFVVGAVYLNSQKICTAYADAYLRVTGIAGSLSAVALWADAAHGIGMLMLGCALYMLAYVPLIIVSRVITPAELSSIRAAAGRRPPPPDHSA